VTRQDLEPDDWHAWKGELARVLRVAAAFGYTHFVRGCRRVVVDGIEPADRSADSVQVEFFEYLYHHVIHKEDAWAARELLRERFRALEHQVLRHPYDHQAIGCLMLYTTPKVMLDELIREPLVQGDVFANANTVILMGRTAQGSHMGRALHIAKHRGSACDDGIHPYRITDSGLVFDPG
jgi:KaiC/GvpD/RAD55 family RecA-like ATPase